MAAKALRRGVFITLEGPEGCGKSTQARLLLDGLKRLGLRCVMTREPGGTKLGEKVRGVLLHAQNVSLSNVTELFLFEACRSQVVSDIIAPALKAGMVVVCDRYSDATIAYQGYGGRVPLQIIRSVDRIATMGFKPDLTIVLDIDPLIGLKRAAKKGRDRMEGKEIAYHRRVRRGYLRIAALEPGRVKVVKVDGDIGQVHEKIIGEAVRVIGRRSRTR